MCHYAIPEEYKQLAKDGKLEGPCFIGQGWSHQVGSDCYGGYVTFIGKNSAGKLYYGLVNADSHYDKCWEDGGQTCVMPKDMTPDTYVIKFRNWWWKCDQNGNRCMGNHNRICYCWNGAYAYQDPSF